VSLAAELAAAAAAVAAGQGEARTRLEERKRRLLAELEPVTDEGALVARRDDLQGDVAGTREVLARLNQDVTRRRRELAASVSAAAEELRGRCARIAAETAVQRTAGSLLSALQTFGSAIDPESSPAQLLNRLPGLRAKATQGRQRAEAHARTVSEALAAGAERTAAFKLARDEEGRLAARQGELLERLRHHGTAASAVPPIATSVLAADLRVSNMFRERVLVPLLADLGSPEEQMIHPDADPLMDLAVAPAARAGR
jgi:chromosome segregation ATPase